MKSILPSLLLASSTFILCQCASTQPASHQTSVPISSLNASGEIQLDLKLSQQRYQVGDPVCLEITPSTDCYLEVVAIDPEGMQTTLYPNAFANRRQVTSGTTLHLPSKAQPAYQLEARPPYGRGLILVKAWHQHPAARGTAAKPDGRQAVVYEVVR